MSVEVRVPTVLRSHTGGERVVQAEGATVAGVIESLVRQFPGLKDQLLNEDGQVRQFVNIYVNDEDIRYLEKLQTSVGDGDSVAILPAVAGGAFARGGRQTAQLAPPRALGSALGSIIETIGHTPTVELKHFSPKVGVRIFAKLEGNNPTGSVKDRIALSMVERAEREGQLSPGATLIEPTSGNTGISLAMVCKLKGYRFKAIMPENVSDERRQLLRAFGAEVVSTDGSRGSNGAIEVAQRMADENPEYTMLYQYGNPANPLAHYETTAPEILEAVPDVDAFVAGLGTGGTLMGVARRLKEHDERIRIVAAEPNLGDLVQGLRNLDEGFVPPIFRQELLDGKFVVTGEESIRYTQELLWREGIFAGVSSGAALSVAVKVAERMESGNVAVLFADSGWKYLSTQLWSKGTEQASDDLRGQLLW